MSEFTDALFDLPPDFEEAAQIVLERIRQILASRPKTADSYMEACATLSALYSVHSVRLPNNQNPTASELIQSKADLNEHWKNRFQRFEADMLERIFKQKSERAAAQVKGGENDFGYAVLTAEEKKEIEQLLQEIRGIVNGSDLSDRKKNALNSRIGALSKEVNRNGTKTDGFFAFFGDLAHVVREMDQAADPALTRFERILCIVMGSRAKREGVKLPPRSKTPQLPSPGTKE